MGSHEMWSKFLCGVDGDIIVVYLDDVFVRLALDGLVLFRFSLL